MMTDILPKIDQRSQQDLAGEIRRLMLYYCPEFESIDEIVSDSQADALINIFANMTGHVIDALNKAPEKNFTAFLNLIGVSPTAPRVAKAALVFKLKDDWDKDGFIPAGSKVSAQAENQQEVVFETENDLTVIRPGLIKAASVDPSTDKWSNQDFLLLPQLTGEEAELFRGELPILHRIYIGHELFALKDASINLKMNLKQNGPVESGIEWFYFNKEGKPEPLKVREGMRQSAFSQSGDISFSKAEKEISSGTISGYDIDNAYKSWTQHWIYAELKSPLTDVDLMPDIDEIKASVDISAGGLIPETAIFNYAPIDLTKDFYPFGERPVFNDSFCFASSGAFSKKDSLVTLDITLSDGKEAPDTGNILLALEYWNGTKWGEFARISKTAAAGTVSSDTTKALTQSGRIKFKCPEIISSQVNGQENYWIRLRIIGGDYGKDGYVDYTDETTTVQGETVRLSQSVYVKPTYKPPSIKELKIDYTYTSAEVFPAAVVTENCFVMADRTLECSSPGKTFKLFSAAADADPAFYLGFDRDISNLPVSLFFPLTGEQDGDSPVVAWEYWNGRKWLTLSVNDAVRDFTRREIQQFTIPGDMKKSPLFGSEQYWIRARLEEGGYITYPRLNAVYSNAVWVGNSNTIQEEILGSSNGEPSQTFQFARTPVLPGQAVKVRETFGQSEPAIWEEVQTFSLSGTDSRHYMLDSSSGSLIFGDGRNGMVPPAGNDNIICDYRYGGGTQGNVQADTIKKTWDNHAGIDSVTNPVPADGGFDQEDNEDAKVRGPHTLKNSNRGITCEDVEWLVREAAPQIALVKCFPTMNRELDFTPGKATVILVPEKDVPKPMPSQELLGEIEKYLLERISTVLNITGAPCLDVIGPDYISVGVEASVAYTTPESGKIIEGRIIDNLKEFLNPLRGGQEKTGWTLGKNLYISEVCSVIKNTAGVDYISDITVKGSVQCYTLNLELLKDGPFKPDVPYPSYSAVKTGDNRIVFALAENLPMNKAVRAMRIKGFRENHILTLTYRNCPTRKLIVLSVDGDILECRTFDGEPLTVNYPEGSDITAEVTQDLTIRSFILNEIKEQSETFFIKIAVPEARDIIYLSRNDEYTNTTPLKISGVLSGDIFLEEDELVYSGVHLINKKPDLKFPYLLNTDTGKIHDLSSITPECRLEEISKVDRRYLEKISDATEPEKCKTCFPADNSLL